MKSVNKYHFNKLKLIYILDYKTMGREQNFKEVIYKRSI